MQKLFQKYNLTLSTSQIIQFEKFLKLFMEYNSHTNLSAIRDEQGIIEKHFIDSLLLAKFEDLSGRLLDIGAGWGFPGIPLKILYPELDVTLLDSVGKKVNAMNHFIDELGLNKSSSWAIAKDPENSNNASSLDSSLHSEWRMREWVIAIKERAEVLALDPKFSMQFDIITSRATAYMPQILEWAKPFLKSDGKIILYKLDNPDELKDGLQAIKKLWLKLQSTHKYSLAEQERLFFVIGHH